MMLPWERWEHIAGRACPTQALSSTFTPEEFDRLRTLRDRKATDICAEFELDERRLRFVRWLIEHGRLRELV